MHALFSHVGVGVRLVKGRPQQDVRSSVEASIMIYLHYLTYVSAAIPNPPSTMLVFVWCLELLNTWDCENDGYY